MHTITGEDCPPGCSLIQVVSLVSLFVVHVGGGGRISSIYWDSVPRVLNPPTPFSRGRSGPTGFPSPQWLPCPPASARHLMTCLNPPNPLFKGAHQASVRTRPQGHRFSVLRPASEDALFGTRGRDQRSGRAWFSRGLLAAARAL